MRLQELRARVANNRLLTASFWVLGLSAASQVIRFGSNLVLTRLLVPETFGLMSLVIAIRIGVEMVSDVGVPQAVVSSDRIGEPLFLRTAWTVRLVRGVAIALLLCAVSYPMSLWFKQPELVGLVSVSGLSAIIKGASHVCELTLARQLRQKTLTLITFSSNLLGTVLMIGLSYWWRSIWALVIAGIAGELAYLISTHVVGRELPMKFRWDPSSIATLRGFGRWVFISSILTYVIGQGDRLILGSMMSLDELGYYSVAANVAGMIPIFLGPLYEHVLFPLYAEEGRQTTPEFRRRLKWTRLGVLALNVPALSLLVGAGDLLINLLWDERYRSAGWMTQVLAAGQLLFAVGRLGPIHFARGESWISLVTEAWRAGVLVASVVIGHSLFGTHGVIGGVALSMACGYPLSVWISRRYGLWFGSVDVLAFAGAAVVIVLCGLTRHAMSFY